MVTRFLKFEETDDGVAKLTYDLGFGEVSGILPIPFDNFLCMCLDNPGAMEIGEQFGEQLIMIPNSTEDLDVT